MIELVRGNLLEAEAEALVNTVNCIGYMGKGIALQFKKAFPENFKAYEKACKAGEVRPGQMLVYETSLMTGPIYIVNFPTKRHWRDRSLLEDIASGLTALVAEVSRLGIKSLAVPPLGCGNGGLEWSVVKPMIEKAFAGLADVHVLLYEPVGPPDASSMPVRTPRPEMTVARALFIRLMLDYAEVGYKLTLLEVQKLAYFLQIAGQPLRLNFSAGYYGPYAPNLNKVLERLEGHFTSGYGDDQRPWQEIRVLDGAGEEAASFLEGRDEETRRLHMVGELIEGFKTPYGMELLASVHWLATHADPRAENAEQAVSGMHSWNPRKRRVFEPRHIVTAWEHLIDTAWLAQAPQ